MKKRLCIFTLLIICSVILGACDSKAHSNSVGKKSEKLPSDEIVIGDSSQQVVLPYVETPLITIESFDDYKEFLAKHEKVTDFVTYDKIQALGDFHSFICLSNGNNGDFSHYMYVVRDDSGYEVSFYIKKVGETKNSGTIIPSHFANANDMRELSASNSGILPCNGVNYHYVSGKLLAIFWETDGVEYTITGSSMLDDYPEQNDTFVGRLMTADTAQLAAFKTQLQP